MSAWKNPYTLSQLNALSSATIHTPLGIVFTKVGDDFLEAEMPVDERTSRPGGYLHGGASVVLAESVASVASLMSVDDRSECFGVALHANHLRAVKEGKVIARAAPVKIGSRLHVWEIKIRDLENQPVCLVQLTVAVVPKKDVPKKE